ncbi:PREDICTED: calcium-binding protein 7 [Colobus angolensis palliatus]|uniref:calcium-binding protein 7 n=1 Tax=Colobus angolensis palliatus TaxID=336983 RepID=UPI0005F542DA|nr:PREDICTED: calcium-binding protein 7 [Colobus angolensis palliatus]
MTSPFIPKTQGQSVLQSLGKGGVLMSAPAPGQSGRDPGPLLGGRHQRRSHMCQEEGAGQPGMKCCRQYVPAAEIQGALDPAEEETEKEEDAENSRLEYGHRWDEPDKGGASVQATLQCGLEHVAILSGPWPLVCDLQALGWALKAMLRLREIREAFKVFDRDGNGFISKQELGTAMRSLGYMPNEVELEVIIQRLDMDGDGQVDFEEFVTLLGPKLSTSGIPEKFHGTDFDTVFWKCDMQKLTVDELKRLLYDTFCEHLSMKDIENIIMTEEESHLGTAEECPVDVETCSNQQIRQTCVRKSLICAFAIAFIISVMLIAANQVLRSGMK